MVSKNFLEHFSIEDRIKLVFFSQCELYILSARQIRIDRNTNSETVLALDVKERSAVYHNGDIYYIDTLNRLSVYKEEDETVNKIDSVYTDQKILDIMI